ncbi:MAG: metal ABC transporter permease [Deltaproteobacteria bacterium]|nr:metal ABC transporter permease [Deltaproteobacteria bacterium]
MHDLLLPVIVAAFVAACASLLGSFAILKRMALVGDAMSHVALPGMGLALLFKFNPYIGAVAFLLVAVVGIWIVQYRSALSIDTIVGVFFTTSLAVGALITPDQDLLEALFGNIAELTVFESAISIIMSVVLIAAIIHIRKKLTLSMISGEIAHSVGINTSRLEFVFLLIFALSVALGIRFVGALLMGSLVIIPAASAKNIAKSLKTFLIWSVVFGVFAATLGMWIAYSRKVAPGPVFILISACLFAASLVVRQVKKAAS